MEIEIMNKLPIKKVVKGLSKLQNTGESVTPLGIGPMSPNLLQASFEIARNYDFPLMFIASRNQVDTGKLGDGYVNGWNQKCSQDDMRAVAERVSFDGLYHPYRDHGRPWQRDNERNVHLSKKEVMRLARQSYLADIENGFGLLMIDLTRDPFEIGKAIPLDVVLQRTVELVAYYEEERKRRSLPEIRYKVGTEETNGGLTSTEKYRGLIEKLEIELKAKGPPMPTFIIGQTGTLTRKTEQVGTYNFHNAYDLAAMTKTCDVELKKHNTDYLDDVTLLKHAPANVTASNVASQYGTGEARAYLKLCEVEGTLKKERLLEKTSLLRKTLLVKTIKAERWRKWMVGEQRNLQVTNISEDEQLSLDALDITGYYTFNDADVKKELWILYENLAGYHIDGQRFVVDHIRRPPQQYMECYHLEEVTSRIRKIIEQHGETRIEGVV